MWLTTESKQERPLTDSLRERWPTALLLNRAGADVERRAQDIADGLADVITLGRLTLANPDVVERISAGALFNEPDPATFYGGDEHGNTDYPTLARSTTVVGL